MANFSTNVQIDFSEDTTFFSVAPASVRAATNSKIELIDPSGNVQVYTGSFAYTYAYGYKYLNWSGSSLTDYAVYDSLATLLGRVTGMSVSGSMYKQFADNNDGNGLVAYAFRGDDMLHGSDYSDVIMAYEGSDRLFGRVGDDTLAGGLGHDTLDGGFGEDYLIGGYGNDSYLVDSDDVIIESPSEGIDTVIVADSNMYAYVLGNNLENAILKHAANYYLLGNEQNNQLTGSAGNNNIDGGLGNDSIDGGAGFDIAQYASADGTVLVNLTAALSSGAAGNDRLKNIEGIFGSRYDDTLVGNAVNNYLVGSLGNDALYGMAGADELIGVEGNDTLDGGLGNDILSGGSGNDVYVVDSSRDLVYETTQLDNNFDAGGVDAVLASASITLSSYIENLYLTGNAKINGVGNSLDNLIVGNSNANIIDGGIGVDTMIGGLGNDTYVVDSVDDVIIELANSGIDTLQIGFTAADEFTLTGHLENVLLKSDANVAILGNDLNNNILGNALDNTIAGGEGIDVLDGGAGSDLLSYKYSTRAINANLSSGKATTGGSDNDTVRNFENVVGSSYSDTITGDTKGNVLDGGDDTGYDWLYGLAGNDLLIGGGGSDQLHGGIGKDTLIGGNGDDLFAFNTKPSDQNVDLILDFTAGVDKIGLDVNVFTKFPRVSTSVNESNFITVSEGTSGTTSNHLLVYNSTNDTLYYDKDGVGGAGAIAIAEVRIVGADALSALDFYLMN